MFSNQIVVTDTSTIIHKIYIKEKERERKREREREREIMFNEEHQQIHVVRQREK